MNSIVVGVFSHRDWFALLDVTVSGTGPRRLDSYGYKLACFLSCVGSQSQRFLKSFLIGNDMIGWENDHCGCMIASHNPTRAERDRGRSIPFGRFSDDV